MASVTTSRNTRIVPLQGIEEMRDPRLPLGMWIFRDTVTGDATGGNMLITGRFPVSSGGATGLQTWARRHIASIEAMSVLGSPQSAGTERKLNLRWRPGITAPDLLFPIYNAVVRFLGDGGSNQGGLMDVGVFDTSKWPLAIPDQNSPVPEGPFWEMDTQNVDTLVLTLTCWGYYWDLLALRFQGGPQRPR